ncbi:MAG: hypothetical protein M3O50_06545 [Myxococcota bacterium]|nr:hypothetical protein [Myxococcota bacterium]
MMWLYSRFVSRRMIIWPALSGVAVPGAGATTPVLEPAPEPSPPSSPVLAGATEPEEAPLEIALGGPPTLPVHAAIIATAAKAAIELDGRRRVTKFMDDPPVPSPLRLNP